MACRTQLRAAVRVLTATIISLGITLQYMYCIKPLHFVFYVRWLLTVT